MEKQLTNIRMDSKGQFYTVDKKGNRINDEQEDVKIFKCRDEDHGRTRCADRCKECQRYY